MAQSDADWYHWATAAGIWGLAATKPGHRFAAFSAKKSGKFTLGTASYLARSAWAASWAAASTPFVRGGSFSPVKLAGSVAAGYAIGATVGTAVSHHLYGKEGASKALEFYKDPFDAEKWKTIGSGIASLF